METSARKVSPRVDDEYDIPQTRDAVRYRRIYDKLRSEASE
jgi:hypothetical protein